MLCKSVFIVVFCDFVVDEDVFVFISVCVVCFVVVLDEFVILFFFLYFEKRVCKFVLEVVERELWREWCFLVFIGLIFVLLFWLILVLDFFGFMIGVVMFKDVLMILTRFKVVASVFVCISTSVL